MTTAPMKSQPLHNFSLPFLKWGTPHPNRTRTSPPAEPDDNDSTRHHRVIGSRSSRAQRLSFPSSSTKPHKDAVEKLQKQRAFSAETVLKEPAAETEVDEEVVVLEEEEEEGGVVGKPWNLRPRKVQEALVDMAVFENRGDNNVNTKAPKSTRLREMVESRCNNGDKKEKNKFWVALSREEIEEDIFILTGSRPARRPRKRPKNVQKQLDNVFPGLWLVGLTVDAYRVADAPMKK